MTSAVHVQVLRSHMYKNKPLHAFSTQNHCHTLCNCNMSLMLSECALFATFVAHTHTPHFSELVKTCIEKQFTEF